MNKVILMGRLTRDPQVRYTQGQDPMAIARFTLAVDRRGRKQEGQQDADFPSCVAFGKVRNLWKVCASGNEDCVDRADPDRKLHK